MQPVAAAELRVLELHPNGHTVYALGNEFGGLIAVADLQRDIDYATYSFVRGQAQTLIDFQTDLAFHPDGTRAFLPGSIGPAGVLFVMDTSDPWTPTLQRVIDLPEVIDVEARPVRIALGHDGLRAYLLSRNDSVTVIEPVSGAVVATINVPSEEGQIAIGPETRRATRGTACETTTSTTVDPIAGHIRQ